MALFVREIASFATWSSRIGRWKMLGERELGRSFKKTKVSCSIFRKHEALLKHVVFYETKEIEIKVSCNNNNNGLFNKIHEVALPLLKNSTNL